MLYTNTQAHTYTKARIKAHTHIQFDGSSRAANTEYTHTLPVTML